jgi:hypothetical protein
MALHSTLSAYIAVGFALAAIYAWGWKVGRRDAYHRSAIRIGLAVGGITEADLRADVIAGRAGGTFTGTSGIMTTGGKASPASANPAVGYRVLANGSAIVAWAAYGDSNLDGQVNLTDINLINAGGKFGQGSSTGATWSQGDYNYSGGVTLTDINLLNGASLFGRGSYLPVAPAGAGQIAASAPSISQDIWIAYALDVASQSTKKR